MNTTTAEVKITAADVEQFVAAAIPEGATCVSLSYTKGAIEGPFWSITGLNWPRTDTERATGLCLADAIAAWKRRPAVKAAKIRELEAELAILKGEQTEVAL